MIVRKILLGPCVAVYKVLAFIINSIYSFIKYFFLGLKFLLLSLTKSFKPKSKKNKSKTDKIFLVARICSYYRTQSLCVGKLQTKSQIPPADSLYK